ncbi:MAG: porin family protein [Nitrosomonadales bacterium]|nr:porin family protein [Nitrosomonadales bacterium]
MKRSVLIATVSLLCIAQPALAGDTGIYLGIGGANGKMSSCVNTSCNYYDTKSEDSGHLRLVGGYDFNKYIGVEAGLSGLGSYKTQNAAGTVVGTVKVSAFTLAAKGGYVFPHGFSVFAKLGLASVNSKYTADPGWTLVGSADQNSTGLVLGAGGQYNLNETVGFRLFTEIVSYKDDAYTSAVGGTTLMAVFKF